MFCIQNHPTHIATFLNSFEEPSIGETIGYRNLLHVGVMKDKWLIPSDYSDAFTANFSMGHTPMVFSGWECLRDNHMGYVRVSPTLNGERYCSPIWLVSDYGDGCWENQADVYSANDLLGVAVDMLKQFGVEPNDGQLACDIYRDKVDTFIKRYNGIHPDYYVEVGATIARAEVAKVLSSKEHTWYNAFVWLKETRYQSYNQVAVEGDVESFFAKVKTLAGKAAAVIREISKA